MKQSSVGVWALAQMRELVKLGVEVHAAMPPGGAMIPAYEDAGVVIHPLHPDFPTRRPWQARQVLGEMRALVEQVQPDLIHSHYVGTTLTMRLAFGKSHPIPRIYQVAGPLHLENAFSRKMEIRTAGSADYWIGTCNLTCRIYREAGIPEERVFLSFHGLDVNQYAPRPRGKLRRELGLGEGAKIVGMVAYIYAPKWYLGQRRGVKGHEDLIDAIALCLETQPNLHCVIVGGAWGRAAGYERRLHAYAKKRAGDRVIFLGTRTDVKEIYPDFDVAVHPSLSENQGGSAESLFLGIPTVTTDVGGFPDVIVPGETGWMAPARQPAQLAEAILDVLADPGRARLITANGGRRAREMFDCTLRAPEVAGIYRTVVSRHADRCEVEARTM